MKLRNLLAASAAATLVATPVLAQATDRATQPVDDESEIGALGSSGILIAVVAAAAVIAGIVIIADDDDDDDPESP